MRLIIVICLCIMAKISYNQTALSNSGADIYTVGNGLIFVNGNLENQTNGFFDNNGIIEVTNDIINDGSNGMFNRNYGKVDLTGGTQRIKGNDIITFYNLDLSTANSLKEQLNNSEIHGVLNLKDAELQTNTHNMWIKNPSDTSVLWNTGYVASDSLGGYLVRDMNTTNVYYFPVGSSALNGIYRGVTVKNNALVGLNTYGVRLAPIDPSIENTGISFTGATGNFDRQIKDASINTINSTFYHNIARFLGTSASEIEIYYSSNDGNYTNVSQWLAPNNSWQQTSFSIASSNSPFGSENMVARNNNQGNFNFDVFALNGEIRDITIPRFISPNGDGKNDELVINNLSYYPNNKLEVFNRYGNLVYQAEPYLNNWDGTVNINTGVNQVIGSTNESLPSATYFFILDLGVNELKPFTGYIELEK